MVAEWPGRQLGHPIQLAVVEDLAEQSGIVEFEMMELFLPLMPLVTSGGNLANCKTGNRNTDRCVRRCVAYRSRFLEADPRRFRPGLGITSLAS